MLKSIPFNMLTNTLRLLFLIAIRWTYNNFRGLCPSFQVIAGITRQQSGSVRFINTPWTYNLYLKQMPQLRLDVAHRHNLSDKWSAVVCCCCLMVGASIRRRQTRYDSVYYYAYHGHIDFVFCPSSVCLISRFSYVLNWGKITSAM